jgi:trigger factor
LPQNLVGKKKGDEGEFTFTYPDDYQNPQLAGKTVRVIFAVEGVLRQILPELTDEVVQQELGLESVEALKEELKRELENRLRRAARASERVQAEDALLQNCQVTLPNALVERFVDELVAETANSLRQQGLSLEVWLDRQGKTLDEYRNELRPDAEWTLKLRFILEAIAEREGITVSDEEIAQLVGEERELSDEEITSLRRRLMEQRVMDLVLTTAEWVESEETPETNADASSNG